MAQRDEQEIAPEASAMIARPLLTAAAESGSRCGQWRRSRGALPRAPR